MTSSKKDWLKYLLWFGAIYHVILGLIGIFAKELVVSLAKNFYNFNLTLDSQAYWIINPLAAYMLIFGGFMAVVASDTVKYKKFINVILVLFVIRVLQRVFFTLASPAGLVSAVDPVREWIDIGLVAAYALSIFLLSRKAS